MKDEHTPEDLHVYSDNFFFHRKYKQNILYIQHCLKVSLLKERMFYVVPLFIIPFVSKKKINFFLKQGQENAYWIDYTYAGEKGSNLSLPLSRCPSDTSLLKLQVGINLSKLKNMKEKVAKNILENMFIGFLAKKFRCKYRFIPR